MKEAQEIELCWLNAKKSVSNIDEENRAENYIIKRSSEKCKLSIELFWEWIRPAHLNEIGLNIN